VPVLHWIETAFTTYVLHPLHGNGYQWWSGEGSDLGQYTVIVAVLAAVQHRNCHHQGCWSVRTHKHPEFGWPACKRHWNEKPEHVD
jgi:hypothetical protein